MLNLNSKGLLIPGNNILSSVEELERVFVKSIQTNQRNQLFNNYKAYSKSLKDLCGDNSLFQWVDGSFVTRKPNPGDIDLVTFINFEVVNKFENKLTDYKFPLSKEIFGVDSYIVRLYPENHRYHRLYLSDRLTGWIISTKLKGTELAINCKKGF